MSGKFQYFTRRSIFCERKVLDVLLTPHLQFVTDQSFEIRLLHSLIFLTCNILNKKLSSKYLFCSTIRQRIFVPFQSPIQVCNYFQKLTENLKLSRRQLGRTRMQRCCVLTLDFHLRLDVKLIPNLFTINFHRGGTDRQASELLLFVLLRLLEFSLQMV